MKRGKMYLAILFILLSGIFLALAFAASDRPAAEDCGDLLLSRCNSCHYLTRVCRKFSENRSRGNWKRTINRMIRRGAKLSKTEEKTLIDCLGGQSAVAEQTCVDFLKPAR